MKIENIGKLLQLREHRKRMESARYAQKLSARAAALQQAQAKASECILRTERAATEERALYGRAIGAEMRAADIDALHYRADALKSDVEAAKAKAARARKRLETAKAEAEEARAALARSSYRVFKTEKMTEKLRLECERTLDAHQELELADSSFASRRAQG